VESEQEAGQENPERLPPAQEPEAEDQPTVDPVQLPEATPAAIDVVLGEEPMELEEDLPQPKILMPEEVKPVEPPTPVPDTGLLLPEDPKTGEDEDDQLPKLPIGCELAGDDIQIFDIQLEQGLDTLNVRELIKICLAKSYPFCLYCNHARKIAVNGYGLALHMIQMHRFHATVNSITGEELQPSKIVRKMRQHFEELEMCAFNLDTFDSCEPERNQTVPYEKSYECFQCRFQATMHKELYLHNRKTHHKNIVFCMMCRINFYSYSELVSHICPGVANKLIILGEFFALQWRRYWCSG
jgi:hypothetical protein